MSTQLTRRATAGRTVALVLALAWSTVGFATTDLWVVIPPAHPDFAGADAMLEAGWGIYLSSLVVVPLLAVVVRPALAGAVTRQLVVVTVVTVPAAALSLDATFLFFGAVLAATAAAQWWPVRGAGSRWGARRRTGRRGRLGNRRRLTAGWAAATVVVFAAVPWVGFMRTSGDHYPAGSRNGAILLLGTVAAAWLLALGTGPDQSQPRKVSAHRLAVLGLTVLGAVPWSGYVLELSAHGRTSVPYLTNGIDHWPALAAFALALVAVPAAALAGWGSLRLAAWTSGLAASALGAFSLLYPDAAGGLGTTWGAAAIGWGVALVLVGALPAPRRRRAVPAAVATGRAG